MAAFVARGREVPVIETERLRLRGHRPEDFPDCAAMWADPVVTRYIGGKPLSEEEAWTRTLRCLGHWAWLGFGYWVVEEKATGSFAGEMGFSDWKREIEPSLKGVPELGWVLATRAHGKGYATEAVRGDCVGRGEYQFGAPGDWKHGLHYSPGARAVDSRGGEKWIQRSATDHIPGGADDSVCAVRNSEKTVYNAGNFESRNRFGPSLLVFQWREGGAMATAAVRMNNPRSERIFFTGMTILILASVLLGFAKSYFLAGVFWAPLPNWLIHVHGAVFMSWILLLVVQASLVARGRVDVHRRLGLFVFGLACLMVIVGVSAGTDFLRRGENVPGFDPQTFYAVTLGDIVIFGTLVGLAFRARFNPPAHKRLILLGTIGLLDDAISRWPSAVLQESLKVQDAICESFILLLVI